MGKCAPRANLVLTCCGKYLPLSARTALAPDVLSNSYRALLLAAGRSGRFEPVVPATVFWSFERLPADLRLLTFANLRSAPAFPASPMLFRRRFIGVFRFRFRGVFVVNGL